MDRFYEIINTKEMGRGLFVREGQAFLKGQVVTECELLVLSPNDTKVANTTALNYYTFKFNDECDCLVLGDGEIFNHDDNANVAYELVDIGDRKIMRFAAIRTIYEGEQLFINYNADQNVDVYEYVKQESLIGKIKGIFTEEQ